MLFSPLIASTTDISSRPSPSPIENRCGVDGVVPHSYMVTLKPPLTSAPMSGVLHANEGDLSFLRGWFQQYEQDASNSTSRRKLEAGSSATRVVHYFTLTQLAVAIEASDDTTTTTPTAPRSRNAKRNAAIPRASTAYAAA